MKRITVVEDDECIRKELVQILKSNSYMVSEVADFNCTVEELSQEIIKKAPDLLLLDVNFPVFNGLNVCDCIRKSSSMPIIFVTANNTSMDELNCILRGGDDYIAKPYQVPILLARIANVLKRTGNEQIVENHLEHKGLKLLPGEARVIFNSKEAELTKNELKILYCLFQHKNQFVSRADLIDELWDNQVFIDDNALSVNVTRIRDKLADLGCNNFIETRRGMGYRI